MISEELKNEFEKVIEVSNVKWEIIEKVCISDANILRPIKGIGFEEYFKKIVNHFSRESIVIDGEGDSDIDLYVNGYSLQLKTSAKASTRKNVCVGVSLHKTHGKERRPFNLYSKSNPTFDYLVLQNPDEGVYIIPYDEIPESNNWTGYLSDPSIIEWNSKWKNRWGLLGLKEFDGKLLEIRISESNSELPFLTSQTNLEDYEIIQMMIKPEYFRAAVMGLKGNLKEFWFKDKLESLGFKIEEPTESYSKYDCSIISSKKSIRIQVKGTSRNMCDLEKNKIGVEVMGTHGQFPHRGYQKEMFDYLSIIISEDQLRKNKHRNTGLQFLFIPIEELPLHYKIGNGELFNKPIWNRKEYSETIYPNIKLKFIEENDDILFYPDLDSYGKSSGLNTIPLDSKFRESGPYILNKIPEEFSS